MRLFKRLVYWPYIKQKGSYKMAKKTIDQQIKEKQTRLDELDLQAKTIQD